MAAEDDATRCYVGNLSWSTTNDDITEYMSVSLILIL